MSHNSASNFRVLRALVEPFQFAQINVCVLIQTAADKHDSVLSAADANSANFPLIILETVYRSIVLEKVGRLSRGSSSPPSSSSGVRDDDVHSVYILVKVTHTTVHWHTKSFKGILSLKWVMKLEKGKKHICGIVLYFLPIQALFVCNDILWPDMERNNFPLSSQTTAVIQTGWLLFSHFNRIQIQ